MEIYKRLKPKKELIDVIEDFKDFLNDLKDEELFIYVSYPDYIEKSVKWDELKKKRSDVATSLLKKEKVSFNKAVELSGLDARAFEDILRRRNIRWK